MLVFAQESHTKPQESSQVGVWGETRVPGENPATRGRMLKCLHAVLLNAYNS